jgi:hypothetical protein
MRHLMILVPVLLASAGCAQTPPLATFDFGQAEVVIQPDGTFAVTDGGNVLLSAGRMSWFGPNWESSSQQQITEPKTSLAGDVVTVTGRVAERASGKPWDMRQTVTKTAEGLRFEYELRPLEAMQVNEVSLIMDLPVARYSGKELLMLPATQMPFPPQLPANYHFVSGRTTSYVFAAGEPEQISLNLDRPRLCNVQDTRVWKSDLYQAFVKIIEGGPGVKPGEVYKLAFTLRPRDPKEWRMPKVELKSAKPLKLDVKSVEPAAPRVGELATLHADFQGTWDTPFWQEQAALDAHIEGRDGQSWDVPGFFTQPFDRTNGGSAADPAELLTPTGDPEWQVRFLPPAAGEYTVTLQGKDRTGKVSATTRFTVADGTPRPSIRVSQTDPHYFEFTDGTPYVANGLNVCWYRSGGTFDYDNWFGHLADNGGNYARIWMPDWAFGFEWGKPGEYKLDRAAQMDYVLALAQQKGIYIKLCLESFRTFAANNPYARANGGPCDKVLDVFTNDQAKAMWRNRLRYCAARWGWSPNILAWEFWNEINCVQGYDEATVQAWAREMAEYLKAVDGGRHLIVNSLGSFVFEPNLWAMPQMQFAQMHGYWHPRWKSTEFGKDMAQMMADHVAMVRTFGKPCFFAEFGLVNDTWGASPRMADDPDGVNLHNGMWGALLSGAAGPAHLWWWDNYVAPRNLWYHYRGVANFVQGVAFNTEGFEPLQGQPQPEGLRAFALRGTNVSLLWIQNRAHTWWNVAEKQPIAPVDGGKIKLDGLLPRGGAGPYAVELWDTYTGKLINKTEVSASVEGHVLTLPTIDKDIAVKVLAH